MKKVTLLTLIFYLFMTACTSPVSPTQPSTPAPDEPVLPESAQNDPTESPTETPIVVEKADRPVVIAYITEAESSHEIVSLSLHHPVDYARIAVDDSTIFQGPAAIDSEHNLYLVYGFKERFVSKLGVDGTVKTIPLKNRTSHTLWIGNKLLVVPETADNEMMVIDQNLDVRVISPSLIYLSDGTRPTGRLGIGNDPSGNLAVWVDTLPVQTQEGVFARYRTLDVDTGEVIETLLPIPESSFLIKGVDIARQNVLICNIVKSLDDQTSNIGILEIHDSSMGKAVTQETHCCLNNIFDLRGDTIVENIVPECCSYQSVRNWSDYQPSFDYDAWLAEFQPPGDYNAWLSEVQERLLSNGRYWIVKTQNKIVIFNEERVFEGVYEFPDDLPENLIPEISLTVAFLLND